jgi:hypothetical protein
LSSIYTLTPVLATTIVQLNQSKTTQSVCWNPLLTAQPRGAPGDEIEDIKPNMAKTRRRSNSSTANMKDFKTKFETVELEPVFDEELHGPMGEELEKQSTTSSDKSIDEEEHDKRY